MKKALVILGILTAAVVLAVATFGYSAEAGCKKTGDVPMCCRMMMDGKNHTHGDHKQGEVKDPVCSMTVDPKTAEKTVYKDETYYFCSKQDKEAFEKAPGKVLEAERRQLGAKRRRVPDADCSGGDMHPT